MIFLESVEKYFPADKQPFPFQKIALEKIRDAFKTKQFVVLQAPTGSGKSVIAKAVSKMANPIPSERERFFKGYSEFNGVSDESGAFVLTTSKQLQNQYNSMFADAPTMKGKMNYQCSVDNSSPVNIAPCIFERRMISECAASRRCPYYNARQKIFSSDFAVLNYKIYHHLPKEIRMREILICDEASELENELIGIFSCPLKFKLVNALIGKTTPPQSEKIEDWFDWIKVIEEALKEKIKNVEKNGLKVSSTIFAGIKDMKDRISQVLTFKDRTDYVLEKNDDGVEFVPLRPNVLANDFFQFAQKILFMSATFIDPVKFVKDLGISPEKVEFIEIASTFNPKNSPIYVSDTYPLSYKTMESYLPKIIENVKKICEMHKHEKGVIHTHSFKITQELKKALRGSRFLFREDASSNEEIVQFHLATNEPTVLVSPSLTKGLDLKGDAGKWQIIIKLPYPSLEGARVKTLFERDKDWYQRQMLKELVQASGRCTRSVEDTSVTYVMDGNFPKTVMRNKKLLPEWFLSRIQ